MALCRPWQPCSSSDFVRFLSSFSFPLFSPTLVQIVIHSKMRSLVNIFLLSLYYAPISGADCFLPDGTSDGGLADPCNLIDGLVSNCCATNRTIPYGEGSSDLNPPDDEKGRDKCLANGLCQYAAPDTEGNLQVSYFRNGCSSQDWKGCVNVCMSDVGVFEIYGIS